MIAVLAIASMAMAMEYPKPKVIYTENFDNLTYNTDYWTVITGQASANADISGVFYGDPNDDPNNGLGKLSLSTSAYTEINFDLYKLIVTDLGYPTDELANITLSYDVAQTNGSAGAYRMWNGYYYGTDAVKLGEFSPEGDPETLTGYRFGNTSINSLDGVGSFQGARTDPNFGMKLYSKINVGQWEWQRFKHEFNVDEYFTMKVFQDDNMDGAFDYVAYQENWHPASGNAAWPYPDGYSIMNRDGVVSWFVDNVEIQLNNIYADWTKILEDKFTDDTINARWTTSGYWTVLGDPCVGGSDTDPCCPWHAMPDKMASAEPNAYFKASITATNPGDLVALTFDVQQSNGSALEFPVFFGFGDAESTDYYIEYASPDDGTYGGVTGAMTMMGEIDPNGNGSDPYLADNDGWWNYGIGEAGMKLSTGKTHIDMIFNPWENYPSGSVNVYFDGVLAAKWTNFRSIFSFDEIFFGIRKNVWQENIKGPGIGGYAPTWNFDNIKVYTRAPQCGDAGYNQYDVNKNCVVDMADFAAFAEQWLECTYPQLSCFQ